MSHDAVKEVSPAVDVCHGFLKLRIRGHSPLTELIVLDNMNEGVMLFDNNFTVVFVNRQMLAMHDLPVDVGGPGTYGRDALRYMAKRGDYGPNVDVEKVVGEGRKVQETPCLILRGISSATPLPQAAVQCGIRPFFSVLVGSHHCNAFLSLYAGSSQGIPATVAFIRPLPGNGPEASAWPCDGHCGRSADRCRA